jgi:hypothetical protein
MHSVMACLARGNPIVKCLKFSKKMKVFSTETLKIIFSINQQKKLVN